MNYLDQQAWQFIADDFVLDNPAEIRRVSWWGFYGGTLSPDLEPPPKTETMRVRFYGARADGLPDDNSILLEASFLNPSRTATGEVVNAGLL